MRHLPLLALLLAAMTSAHAGPRTSASYTITADTLSSGGVHVTSASYSGDGSLGGISGTSSVASPAETLKSGYIGQLTEVTAVQLAATQTTLNEATTQQITATATLDDATTTSLLGSDLSWNVLSGPLASISSSGLATAGNVYQTTAATAQGSFRGIAGTLGFTINNTGTDDLGIYAADGIPDTWQAQYFGVNNPLGTATADASGTGQNNLFKYTAGLNPTDHAARFLTTSGGAGGRTITISPRLSDRTYTVQYSTNFQNWLPLTGATIQDNGQTRTVTDPDGVSTRKFYRVQISYP
ncbi:hypothetical protein [Prosthecobacter sp.]|uniref:hypothetical protein n=1 Tax=Prosthecobacter sp. TaxID=1965333 RepID=UPI00378300CA